MKVAVTGANGFVGRHLVPFLSQRECVPTAIVRTAPNEAADDIRTIALADSATDDDFRRAFDGQAAVIHLAGRAHVIHDAAADPRAAFHRANVELTVRVAHAAIAAGTSRFIFVSSIGVLGNATPGEPFRRTSAAAPVEDYAASKLEAEERLRVMFDDDDRLVIVRPPLVYGPGAKGNFERLMKLVQRLPVLPFGAIAEKRSYVHVRNLCGFLHACLSKSVPAGTYVVADGADLSLPDLLRIMADEMRKPCRLWSLPPIVLQAAGALVGRGRDVRRLTTSLRVDDALDRELTGWVPRNSPEDGVREMVREFLRRAA